MNTGELRLPPPIQMDRPVPPAIAASIPTVGQTNQPLPMNPPTPALKTFPKVITPVDATNIQPAAPTRKRLAGGRF
jgi:hypothetical protein